MFYEDLSCPKLLGNTNWVFPITPNFYSVNDSGNDAFYESKLLKASKTSDVLYAEFSETNNEIIAEIQFYSKDYKPTKRIQLKNGEIKGIRIDVIHHTTITIYGFIKQLTIQNPISIYDYWYKVIVKSNISVIKIFGL